MLCLVLQWFQQIRLFPCDCLIHHPYLLLKCRQSLTPWNKLQTVAFKYMIFTDSHSCLYTCLHYMKLEHPLIGMVIRKFANKDIFCWVPSHIGIRGNIKADFAVTYALDLFRIKVGALYTDIRHHINQYIFFPLGKIVGMVPSRTSFILSSRSWTSVSFILNFNLYNCDKHTLHSSIHCVYNLIKKIKNVLGLFICLLACLLIIR